MPFWKPVVLYSVCLIGLTCSVSSVAEALPKGEDNARTVLPSTALKPESRPLRLIVGFMGGRVKADNLLHREAAMAQELRDRDGEDLKVLVFANHDGGLALRTVLGLVDRNGDHAISEAERQSVDIAIYGHSWGASEAINLARSLAREGVPVALTVQVDSVQKPGENDQEIPPNVHEAVNLYQRDGLLRGRGLIHAEDSSKTRILVNQQYHYGRGRSVDIARFPWFARTFMRQHIMIENDPEVWQRVEMYLSQAMQHPGK